MKTVEIYKGIEIKVGYNGVKSASEGTGLNRGRRFLNKLTSIIWDIDGMQYGMSIGSNNYKDYLRLVKIEIDSKL